MIADTDIQRAAEELVERYGDNALTVAQEHTKAHTTSQDQSGLNVALYVALTFIPQLRRSWCPATQNAPARSRRQPWLEARTSGLAQQQSAWQT